MFSGIAFIVGLLLFNNALGSNVCVHRDFGKGSTVCVCNSSQCHSFEPIVRTRPSIVIQYESGKSGKRFEKQQHHFTDESAHLLPFGGNEGKTVTLKRTKKYQKIIGFGGAFTDAAGINIKSLDSVMSEQIIKDFYSPQGLAYTVARVPIAGSDFSEKPYTYDDSSSEDLNLNNFKLTDEDLKYKIPLLSLAKNISSTLKVFASPWSAPAWMKTNNNITGKGSLKGGSGGPYFKAWADYIVKFLRAYEAKGINMWGLTVQNEPLDGQMPDFVFNCMGYTPEQQRDFVSTDLGPALKAANFGVDKLKLMVHDDQRPFINKWTEIILNDTSAAQYISGVAFHWYLNAYTSPSDLDKFYEKYPEYFLLSTEACEGSSPFVKEKVSLGSWDRAESYAYDIITDLQHYTSGWIDWNLALDEMGGPNWVKNFVDAPIIVNKTGKEYYKQPMYYALAHFTRLLPPESQRIDTNDTGVQVLETVVFETPENGTVLVALNRLNDTIPLRIVDPKNGVLAVTVPSHSIQSYVWYN